jgi:hypothetical protein
MNGSKYLPFILNLSKDLISTSLADSANRHEFVVWGQFHLKIALDAIFGQIPLDFAGRKLNSAAIVGGSDDVFGKALIDVKKLIVTQIQSETDKLIAGHS